MANSIDTWKRLHSAGERELTRVLLKFYRKQNARILEGLGDTPVPSMVSLAFSPASESQAMLDAITPTLIGMMATGANRVLKQAAAPRRRKDAASDAIQDFELPARIEEAILAGFKDLAGQSYWEDIQKNYAESITDFLTEAIKEGLPGPKLAKKLREAMAGMSKVRAAAIARTETTQAYNAGHDASYVSLAEDGLIEGVEWLVVMDDDTRHAEMNGIIIPAGQTFDLNGTPVKWPGAPNAPAKDRVNCRCTTAAVMSM